MANNQVKPLPAETIISLAKDSDALIDAWALTATEPGVAATPHDIPKDCQWIPATVPGTVHTALNAAGNPYAILPAAKPYDQFDWWYQCRFTHPHTKACAIYLHLDGLASLAEVWLNGQLILNSENMFIGHKLDIRQSIQTSNHLLIVFRSLDSALKQKRPRPRWKTNLIDQQPLRWFRTTLLGHIPGWAGANPAVGPWRSIYLSQTETVSLTRFQLNSELHKNQGVIQLNAELNKFCHQTIDRAVLVVDQHEYPLKVNTQDKCVLINAELIIDKPPLWWPHTHGTPNLTAYELHMVIDKQSFCLKSGQLGFKHIEFINHDQVGFRINRIPVFCRGACWSNNDINDLVGEPETLRQNLQLAKAAGINMLRIGGTMVYESDLFYQLCDEMGILIWHDFMFANMDYPIDDDTFRNNVNQEIDYQLQRLHLHACIALYCGNSEVEQQAAMFGLDQEAWQNDLFYQILPDACRRYHPSIAYIPSSPYKGALPFHISSGVSHYFAVGAYQRDLNDPSLSQVKFTSECLGISNMPGEDSLMQAFNSPAPAVHHPAWKSGVPRDNTAGWDFEDIRDHYLQRLFKLDPHALRYADNERYIALSKVVSGELMQTVYGFWRSGLGQCQGGLLWFYKDLLPGAGWGIVDCFNRPKPVYYYLKRIWDKQIIVLNDQQLDGLSISVINENSHALNGCIELSLLSQGRTEIARAEHPVELSAYSKTTLLADQLLHRFYDINYAYRFGPAKHDVVIAKLKNHHQQVISESFYFPNGHDLAMQAQANIQTEFSNDGDDLILHLQSDCFLQAVELNIRDYVAADNYFHLAPNCTKPIRLTPTNADGKRFKGSLKSLNIADTVRLQL